MSLSPAFFLSSVAAVKNVVSARPFQVGERLLCKHEEELSGAAATGD